MIEKALQTYVETIGNGYDQKFQIHAKQVKLLIPQQLRSYMTGAQASGFFTCTETYAAVCCSGCSSGAGGCSTCDNSENCQSGQRTRTVDCPTSIPTATGLESQPSIAYTLTNEDGFFAEILDKYGIGKSWIIFGNLTVHIHPGCAYAGEDVEECMRLYNTFWSGFPMTGTINVQDPKDLIAPMYDNSVALASLLRSTRDFAAVTAVEGATTGDLVDAASITALMTDAAVYNMGQVVETTDEISADERQNIIFNFIMGALMLIPAAGVVLDAALLALMATIIRSLGILADVALSMYDVIQSPESGIWILFDLLTLAAGSKSPKDLGAAGAQKRGLSNDDLNGLKPHRGGLDKIEACRTTCWNK